MAKKDSFPTPTPEMSTSTPSLPKEPVVKVKITMKNNCRHDTHTYAKGQEYEVGESLAAKFKKLNVI